MTDYRSYFADFGGTAYLNCAYQGVFPLAAVARGHLAIEQKCHPERMDPDEYFDLPRRVRNLLAEIIGCHADEIALTCGATQGIGVVAAGLQLAAGDEVVVAANNFPANLFTWLYMSRRGVRVKVLRNGDSPLQLEDVAHALTRHTRVVALDWVDYSTGRRIDLASFGELAHQNGALFVVDGTQAVGALELDVHELPVDALAVAAYKWLLGPYGTGFVYVKDELLDRLDLRVVNWLSVNGADDFDALPIDDFALARAARIFDVPETANFLNLSTLEASLEFVRGVGAATVRECCGGLLDLAAEGLKARGYCLSNDDRAQLPSPILSFQCESSAETDKLYAELKSHHVEVSLRHHRIRVSPYLYNTEEDVGRLLEIAEQAR